MEGYIHMYDKNFFHLVFYSTIRTFYPPIFFFSFFFRKPFGLLYYITTATSLVSPRKKRTSLRKLRFIELYSLVIEANFGNLNRLLPCSIPSFFFSIPGMNYIDLVNLLADIYHRARKLILESVTKFKNFVTSLPTFAIFRPVAPPESYVKLLLSSFLFLSLIV